MPPNPLERRIASIGHSADRAARNLLRLGYRFDLPERVLPGPEPGTPAAIERIEREIGPLPLALKLWWIQVGGVNFSGSHPDWAGCDYPDPLIVYPPSTAIAELDEFLADRQERERFSFPYLVPIAPDALHKANVSGGMWYNIDVPALADDPPLNDEPHNTTFLTYLELALRWGGFPGLENSPSHTWTVSSIVNGNSNPE